jgi:hypothetical protein
MTVKTRSARITGPMSYMAAGSTHTIPSGPCLLESAGEQMINIIWGAQGQKSVSLPAEEVEAARRSGNLVLLD